MPYWHYINRSPNKGGLISESFSFWLKSQKPAKNRRWPAMASDAMASYDQHLGGQGPDVARMGLRNPIFSIWAACAPPLLPIGPDFT